MLEIAAFTETLRAAYTVAPLLQVHMCKSAIQPDNAGRIYVARGGNSPTALCCQSGPVHARKSQLLLEPTSKVFLCCRTTYLSASLRSPSSSATAALRLAVLASVAVPTAACFADLTTCMYATIPRESMLHSTNSLYYFVCCFGPAP